MKPNIDAVDITHDLIENTEVCVIGTGAGGAVAAKELSEAGFKVIALEAGPWIKNEDLTREAIIMTHEYYWEQSTLVTLGKPNMPIPIGRGLGGTTTFNSGTCFRIPDKTIQRWQTEFGLDNLTAATLTPYYEKIEKNICVTEVPESLMGRNNLLFLAGAKKLNYSHGPLKRNMKNCTGVGLCGTGCPTGAKQDMRLNYIPMALKNGTKIYTNCFAEKILTKNGKTVGVSGYFTDPETLAPTHKIVVKAQVVIVAAGATRSPLILMKSKIANSSKQLGKNLHVHPCSKVIGVFEEDVKSWDGIPQASYVDEFVEEGLLFEGFFIPPSLLASTQPGVGMELKELIGNYNKLAGYGIVVIDTSEGKVRSIFGRPFIFYKFNQRDIELFRKGVMKGSEIFFAAGAKRVVTPIHQFPIVRSMDDIEKIRTLPIKPEDLELIAFHPMGTCRMGADPKTSVVNKHLETHDIKNLYVCDASVFPTATGTNPMVGIMAFSNYACDYIKSHKKEIFT